MAQKSSKSKLPEGKSKSEAASKGNTHFRVDLRLEILLLLLREKCHIRGLALVLNTNHMNILRKAQELVKANVLDFKQEGKNKSYFIKKSAEARLYSLMAEQYKLARILSNYPELRSIINILQEDKRIKLAVLFGSYAKGIAKEESDIDIYVETESIAIKKELSAIDSRLGVKIGKFDQKNLLIREIIKNHALIKGFEEFYKRTEVFE